MGPTGVSKGSAIRKYAIPGAVRGGRVLLCCHVDTHPVSTCTPPSLCTPGKAGNIRPAMELASLRAKIRDIKNFPTAGILFKDITTLLKDGPAFRYVVDLLA